MKNFIIYNGNGTILRTGCCPDEMFDIQRASNEFIKEGIADDSRHYIDKEDNIVEFTEEMKLVQNAKRIERESKRQNDRLIRNKIDEIIRNQAINELKKEGKLKDII